VTFVEEAAWDETNAIGVKKNADRIISIAFFIFTYGVSPSYA
jgi:hypothetical protein